MVPKNKMSSLDGQARIGECYNVLWTNLKRNETIRLRQLPL